MLPAVMMARLARPPHGGRGQGGAPADDETLACGHREQPPRRAPAPGPHPPGRPRTHAPPPPAPAVIAPADELVEEAGDAARPGRVVGGEQDGAEPAHVAGTVAAVSPCAMSKTASRTGRSRVGANSHRPPSRARDHSSAAIAWLRAAARPV